MSHVLRLQLLGGLDISRDGAPLTGFVSTKAVALLAYLAITAEPHRRETLANLFWGASAEEDGRASLRVVLSNLRQTVGRDCLVTSRTTVAFNRGMPYWLDVEAFETRASATPAVASEAVSAWREAAELYGGALLEGVAIRDVPRFDEWLMARREHLRQLAARALDGLVDDAIGDSDASAAVDYLERLLALDPWHEDAHRRLMTALAHSGRRNAAIVQYERCRQMLADELGVDPEPETAALYEAILAGELHGGRHDAAASRWNPDAASTSHRSAVAPHTSFIGREAELRQIVARLDDPSCRLVTLLGPGGIGKSRLAIQASADRRLGFRDGAHFVALAALNTPELIVPTIAATLGVTLAESESPARQLERFLEDKTLLLVLDNFEQLIDGAPLLNDILDAAPGVKLLVTSRERLALRAEWLVPVRGLPVPDDAARDDVSTSPAVRLFTERARQARPGFDVSDANIASLIGICRLLEGMPLGIEIAAGWTRTHTCAEIAAGIERNLDFLTAPLRDTPARHHSLRAVFMHSWALLDPAAQAILQALSVFRGGFLPDAAAAVASASRAELADLIDKSLLHRATSGRYALHELVRQYASEQLAASPDASAAQRRHAAYFTDYVHAAEPLLKSNDQQAAILRLLADIDNVRAAWRWALAHLELGMLGRALDGWQIFTDHTGRLPEATESLERALAALDARPPAGPAPQPERDILRGRLLGWLSRHHMHRGRFTESEALMNQSLALLERHAAGSAPAYWQDTRAIVANAAGRKAEARRLQQAALEASEAQGDRIGMALAFRGMAGIAVTSGQLLEARRLFAHSHQIHQEMRDWDNTVRSLTNLGHTERLLGNYREARRRLEEALAIQRERGSSMQVVLPLTNLGELGIEDGRLEHAEQSFRQARDIALRFGLLRSANVIEYGLATLLLFRGELDQALAALAEPLADAQAIGFTNGVLGCLELQALILAHTGDWQASELAAGEMLASARTSQGEYHTARAETLLGRAATARGDVQRAGQSLIAAYERLACSAARPAILDTVASVAGLLAAGSDNRQRARATELLSVVLRDPATWYRTRTEAGALLATLSTSLPAPAFEAARQRGAEQTLSDLALTSSVML